MLTFPLYIYEKCHFNILKYVICNISFVLFGIMVLKLQKNIVGTIRLFRLISLQHL